MKKYKVNYDRKKPSSEEILSRRDFDGLMKQYKAAPGKVVHKPFWKSGWFIGSMATVAVVASAVVIYNNKENSNPRQNQVSPIAQNAITKKDSNSIQNNSVPTNSFTTTKRKISPPIPSLQIRNFSYKFNATKGCTFTHNSGTKITFPANAFVDANGNTVTGNVEIQYREFRDQADFFLSGIPMQYDSLGKTYQFESAGMMQISGFINGKEVFLKKDKKVKVEFASKNADTKYNLYKFDTLAGNWNYIGKDQVVKKQADTTNQFTSVYLAAWEQVMKGLVKPIEPIRPIKGDKNKYRFTVAFDAKEFPEMNEYKDSLFQVDETNQKFNPAWYKITWEDIHLMHGSETGKYKLALKKGKENVILNVYPVLSDKAYGPAMEKYEAKNAEYKKALEKYNSDFKQATNAITQAKNNVPLQYQNGAMDKTSEVIRLFEVSSFGIYNMDCLAMLPVGNIIDLNVNGDDGKIFINFTSMYHVDRQKNCLISYHNQNPMSAFHFNPKSSNLIWAVRDGKLFYSDNDDFAKLPISGNASIGLKEVKKDFKSPEEMKKFFKIGQVVQK